MANLSDVKALQYDDPVESLLQFVREVKPFHTKILDVMVEYHYSDTMEVHMKDDNPFKEIYIYQPFYDPTKYCLIGFGDKFDDHHPWGSCEGILKPPSECEQGYSIDPWGIGIGECIEGEVLSGYEEEQMLCKNGFGIQPWDDDKNGYSGPVTCERIYTEQDFDDYEDINDPSIYPYDPLNPNRTGLPKPDRYMVTQVVDKLSFYWDVNDNIFDFEISNVQADPITGELYFVVSSKADDPLGRSTARAAAELLQVGDRIKVSDSPGNDGVYTIGEKIGISGSTFVRGAIWDQLLEITKVYVNTEIPVAFGGGNIHPPFVSLATTIELHDNMFASMVESGTTSVYEQDALIGGFDVSLFDVGGFDEIII